MTLLPGYLARLEKKQVSRELDRVTGVTQPERVEAFRAAVKRCGCSGAAVVRLEDLAWRMRIDGNTAADVLDEVCG